MWDLAPHTCLYLKCAVHTDKKNSVPFCVLYYQKRKKNQWLAPPQFVALIIQLESFKSLLTYSAERCSSVKNIFSTFISTLLQIALVHLFLRLNSLCFFDPIFAATEFSHFYYLIDETRSPE